jgi:hypothetical protein
VLFYLDGKDKYHRTGEGCSLEWTVLLSPEDYTRLYNAVPPFHLENEGLGRTAEEHAEII